ncbi:MAG: hypothetical protein RJA49_2072 [Actinomycetota bacterium]
MSKGPHAWSLLSAAMASGMLSEQSFGAENVRAFTDGAPVTRTMTVKGTAAKTFVLLVITVALAAVGWNHAGRVIKATSGPGWLLGYFLLIALSVFAARRPKLALGLSLVYAVMMGLWMGAISRIYDQAYEGIVLQTLAATVGTFLVCLVLYTTRSVKVTGKFVMVLSAAIGGLLMLYVFGWIWSLFSGGPAFFDQLNGVGFAISVFACVLAALSLFVNFAIIEGGAAAGAPKGMEWYAAFGLLSTLVWLYLEILELIARTRARQ